jgi:hypothetical protein
MAVDHDAPAVDPPSDAEVGAFDYALETSLLQFAALTLVENGVTVNAQSFRLMRTDVASVRRSMESVTETVTATALSLTQVYEPVKARLETVAARHWTEAEAAWLQYFAFSRVQEELLEIRQLQTAMRIVRENARLIRAATCANLLEALKSRAEKSVASVLEHLEIQLHSDSSEERIAEFLERTDSIATRALGKLALLAVARSVAAS